MWLRVFSTIMVLGQTLVWDSVVLAAPGDSLTTDQIVEVAVDLLLPLQQQTVADYGYSFVSLRIAPTFDVDPVVSLCVWMHRDQCDSAMIRWVTKKDLKHQITELRRETPGMTATKIVNGLRFANCSIRRFDNTHLAALVDSLSKATASAGLQPQIILDPTHIELFWVTDSEMRSFSVLCPPFIHSLVEPDWIRLVNEIQMFLLQQCSSGSER